METPTLKARSAAAVPMPLERQTSVARPRIEVAAAPKKAKVYRSLTLRPDEYLAIVAAGRRRS